MIARDGRFVYGKHKGESISEVEIGYLRWAASCNNLRPWELDNIQTELAKRDNKNNRTSSATKNNRLSAGPTTCPDPQLTLKMVGASVQALSNFPGADMELLNKCAAWLRQQVLSERKKVGL